MADPVTSCHCPTQPLRVTRWHQGSCPRALEMEYLGRLPPIPPPTESAPSCWPFLLQRDVWFLKHFASLMSLSLQLFQADRARVPCDQRETGLGGEDVLRVP